MTIARGIPQLRRERSQRRPRSLIAVFLVLRKAFDLASHEAIVSALEWLGCSVQLLKSLVGRRSAKLKGDDHHEL